MEEDFEGFIRSQLIVLKNQMEVIKAYLNKYEEKNLKLKKTITDELITALITRFEKNERLISGLNEKIDTLNFKFHDNLSRSLKDLREEISETELSKAISKIVEEKEIKVSSRVLDELKNV